MARRFFIDIPLSINNTIVLSDEIYHHWIKVLRANINDTAVLFNGQGGEYTAQLIDINKKQATVMINSFYPINRTLPYKVTLAQAISKADHMDYTVQKSCELGVHSIQLISTERSERLRYERDAKKLIHWQKIAISACEQCGLNIIPKILPPIALSDYLTICQDTLKIIMSLPNKDCHHFTPNTIPLPTTISLLVGAEGGLSDNEIRLCHLHGFLSWTIGERILRTETASVAALASLQVLKQIPTNT